MTARRTEARDSPPPAPLAPPPPKAQESAGGPAVSPAPRPARDARATERSRWKHALAETGDFLKRVYKHAGEDNIFFLAGAIAFNVVVAIVPLILAALGVAGLLLQSRYGPAAADRVIDYVFQALPALDPQLLAGIRSTLNDIIEGATGYVGIGTLFLVWISTRMVGTLRTALREVFDIQEDRGIIAGKFFDMGMVIAAGTLLAVNVGLYVVIQLVGNFGTSVLGIDPERFQRFDGIILNTVAFLSIWFMFVLIYRYLPARRTQWRIAAIAATFTGLLYEIMKLAFGWYVTNLASYNSTYGNFATVVIVFLWIYYMSVAFVLGGIVGQVAAVRRTRRRQKERLN